MQVLNFRIEVNNPYSNGGKLDSLDTPSRGFLLQGGNVGDDYRSQLWFQEFARLEIEGVWTVISDPQLWRVDFKMKKTVITESLWGQDVNSDGDTADIVTESMLGLDLNGDGDMLDQAGYWNNNGSASANNNSGA